tara:strand:+ start:374 stop:1021 length:648 start_codon:yes stop_codon:yes gene_type:complete
MFFCFIHFNTAKAQIPSSFVYMKSVIPSVVVDLKYFSKNNFVGEKIKGYHVNRAIITKEAALALKNVQEDLNHFGYGIKIFDSYRPQMAVDYFGIWARSSNRKMKQIHYPNVKKRNLFKEGYLASKSGHSRGSTVDLTIIDKSTGIELDMGTIYDFFGKESWMDYEGLNANQKQNRFLLQSVMKKYGFKSLKEEWWHFTLHNEPFPEQYFNFMVK